MPTKSKGNAKVYFPINELKRKQRMVCNRGGVVAVEMLQLEKIKFCFWPPAIKPPEIF